MKDTRFIASRRIGEAELALLARQFAPILRKGDVLELIGELGAGKSSFARALIRALTSEQEEVPSPTFTLLQSYDTLIGPLAHYDFYRVKDPAELQELALDEAMEQGVCVIEWPEIARPFLPETSLQLILENDADPAFRLLSVRGDGVWRQRLEVLFPS